MLSGKMRALHAVFPPRCIACGEEVGSDFGLCRDCWEQITFASGVSCDGCGVPLPGNDDGQAVLCDECLAHPRPWARGRTVMMYSGIGRELVLGFKHSDRLDLARPFAAWMARAAQPLLTPETVIAPVPLHRWRLLRRRYNQSALLSQGIARICGQTYCVDLFERTRNTTSQKGRDRAARIANLADAIRVTPARAPQLLGRPVLIVDDVMTSGATLTAATGAAMQAGADRVDVITLARVAKAP
ncbi:competence protein ComF [Thioclava dalianensis]|uniref:Competence protein ComF n=1 Tax=Thioclava dalianensis TaxID=1185766 RepID=A0A074TAE8_9RHOB|nr:competence protein ComF [Thioclava dalianensis]